MNENGAVMIRPSNSGMAIWLAESSGVTPSSEASQAAREMEREQGKDRKPDRDGREELWLEEMARVLLADEICRRRCRRQRRRQRIWAPGFPI